MRFPQSPAPWTRRALRGLAMAACIAFLAPAALPAPALADNDAARPAPAAVAPAAPAGAAPASPAAAPHPLEGPSFAPMGMSLLVVLALMAGILWVMRRAGLAPRAGAPGLLRLVGQLSLGPRERVVIVEAGERWLLLGVGAAGISRLASLPKSESGAGAQAPATFGSLLERLRKGGA